MIGANTHQKKHGRFSKLILLL